MEKYRELYERATAHFKARNSEWLRALETCADALYEQITADDVDLCRRVQEITTSDNEHDTTKMLVWSSTSGSVRWCGYKFKHRVLLKGPDHGRVFGYPWLTRKGVEPVLLRLKRHYEPFDVHFAQESPRNGSGGGAVSVYISWP